MDKIKKGLGRGLSSLIGETKVEIQKNQLPVSDLMPNKYQPRKNFDESNLEDLTNSIKERGMIQPIIVRKSNNENSKFEIIAGERRWLAAQRAGIHNVPVVVTSFSTTFPDDVNYIKCNAYGTSTWVPALSSITVNVKPVYNRRNLRQFSLKDYSAGKLQTNGRGYI